MTFPLPAGRRTLIACCAALLPLAGLRAQQVPPPSQGVRIGLVYQAGTRPGLYVLPMRGPHADSIRAILTRDLDFGDRISVIAPDSGMPPTGALNYPIYARLGAAAVLQLVPSATGISVTLHDVGATKVLSRSEHPLPAPALSPEWRMAVHQLSDGIEAQVTGVTGIAATRILFVRNGSLWQVDSDGANAGAIPGTTNALGPAWHPRGFMIAYYEWREDGTHVMVRDLATGTTRRVSTPGGTNASPAFSPDGRTLVYANGEDGTDLLAAPLDGRERPFRVTVGRGSTNSQPSYSPDGRRIAFTSSRLGRQEVYITDADGANPELLTTSGFGDQLYRADPSWSPDGRYVAFSTQITGRFQIATIGLRDRGVKQHTVDGSNEDPSWAPDARHVVFTSTRTGSKQLWVLDTESGRLRQLTHGGGASRMAAWSPRFLAAR